MWNQNTIQQKAPIPAATDAAVSAPASNRALFHPTTVESGAAALSEAIIGKSLLVKGEISGSESLYVDGHVEGIINLPGQRVTVGPNGEVAAAITALEVVVQGKIIGNVQASDRLEVRSEGSLTGDVTAQRVSLADGAFFNGKIDIRRPGPGTQAISDSSDRKQRDFMPRDVPSESREYAQEASRT